MFTKNTSMDRFINDLFYTPEQRLARGVVEATLTLAGLAASSLVLYLTHRAEMKRLEYNEREIEQQIKELTRLKELIKK